MTINAGDQRGVNLNILHIEQSILIKEMVHDVVKSIGHKYFSTQNAEDAFRLLEENKINFVITGLELSDTSGDEWIKSLHLSKYKDVPVIVLTSTDNMEIRKKLFNLGVVDYIVKDSITDEKLKDYIEAFEVRDEVLNKMHHQSVALLDDSKHINTMIKNIFNLHGIKNVDSYYSAEDLLASNKDYAIYILDLILPGISGKEALLTLRKKAKNSIIILISSINNYKTISNILSSGADDFINKPFDASVFMAKIKAHSRNFILREELEYAYSTLEKVAITDGLTQLFNHHYIINQVEREIERAKRYGHNMAVVLLDIDNFKYVNDNYGHQTGDEILQSLAICLKGIVRKSDSVGRYGGEEFLVILPETNLEHAKICGEKIRKAVENMRFSVKNLKITISGGGVALKEQTAIDLIKQADEGLYESKYNGKNRITYKNISKKTN